MKNHEPQVFVSYEKRSGLEYARTIKDVLAQHGVSAYVADDEARQGAWSTSIDRAIDKCRIFALVVTEAGLTSKEVQREAKRFLARASLARLLIFRYRYSLRCLNAFHDEVGCCLKELQEEDFENLAGLKITVQTRVKSLLRARRLREEQREEPVKHHELRVRVTRHVLDKLSELAAASGEGVESIVSRAVENHALYGGPIEGLGGGLYTFPKSTANVLLRLAGNGESAAKELRQSGRDWARKAVRTYLAQLGRPHDFESLLWYLKELKQRYFRAYDVSITSDGGTYSVVLEHQLEKEWDYFNEGYLDGMFSEFCRVAPTIERRGPRAVGMVVRLERKDDHEPRVRSAGAHRSDRVAKVASSRA